MKRTKILAMIGVLVLSSGCASLDDKKNVMKGKAITRAAFDLSCAEKDLRVTEIDNTTYGVSGCGKKSSYIVHDSNPKSRCFKRSLLSDVERYCSVIKNGEITTTK